MSHADSMTTLETFQFTLIIPAHNEADRLYNTVNEHQLSLEREGIAFEIIVVDDGSTDDTAGIVRDIRSRTDTVRLVSLQPRRGKGAAVYAGVKAARGDVIGFTDADLAYTPSDVANARSPIEAGHADLVIGARDLPESTCAARYPLTRRLSARLFSQCVSMMVVKGIVDTQCGLKVFSREAALAIFPRMSVFGFAFDVEMLALGMKFGVRIRKTRVHLAHSRASKVRLLRDSAVMFSDLARIRRRMKCFDVADYKAAPPDVFERTACVGCGAERYDARVIACRSDTDVLQCGHCGTQYESPRE
jgi:dolichyl-phosphate beta-glucosyltransferase